RPWIFTIVANTVRNHFRSDCTRRSVFDHREAPDIPDPVGGTERQVAASELVGHVEQAIARLPFAQREVLVLTTIEGMRQKDVAEILRIPANTVKTHLRRARLALTRSLSATLAVDSGGDHGAL
ncbi:MAG: RNA polymerase sigma factor, partial [Gammaproteobacteria bacterium]|nr:RNA polymerase sigma factor [Gammaproteobacteria bacterium]